MEALLMGKVVVVTSGKGGVGKTTSTAALGAAVAKTGKKVALVDFDVGLRNLDLIMGAERRVVFDLVNVIQGTAKLSQALIRDKRLETLYLLPASQTRDKDALTEEGVAEVIARLRSVRCCRSTMCWRSCRRRCSASSPRVRMCCAPPTSARRSRSRNRPIPPPRLTSKRQDAWKARTCRWSSPSNAKASSTGCSEGGPHEHPRPLQAAHQRAGGARAAAAAARL